MARSHGRIYVTIWQDPDFLALPGSAQRLYLFLTSQANLNHLGVLPLTLRRWAQSCAPYSVEELRDDLAPLERARFVVVDGDTEEVLIRSLLRGDGVYKQPNVLRAAVTAAEGLHSAKLKRVVRAEVERIAATLLVEVAEGKREEVAGLLRTLAEGLAEPLANPSSNPSGTPHEGSEEPPTHARAQPLPLSPTPSFRGSRPARPDPIDGFADFWQAYPRKVSKGSAERAYRSARKHASVEVLLAGVQRFAATVRDKDPEFIPHAATWLNGKRWEDTPTLRAVGDFDPATEWIRSNR